MTQETPISDKVDRIETIVETLENGDVSLEEARNFTKRDRRCSKHCRTISTSVMAQSSNSDQTSLQPAVSFSLQSKPCS